MSDIKISIVTSVYNAENFIGETIESIINQTYDNWEYILIDDCSKDRSVDIIKKYVQLDSRIRLITNEKNKGQCENLNEGIRLAKGDYIARVDHDDVCNPERFEMQLSFMENNPNAVLVGATSTILKNGRISDNCDEIKNMSSEEIRLYSFINSPFAHSSFFIRKSAMIDNGILYGSWDFAEDYDLVTRLLAVGEVCKIKESLVSYREDPSQLTRTIDEGVILSEGHSIRNSYIASCDFDGKAMLRRINEQNITKIIDLRMIEKTILDYARWCGLNEREMKGRCIKETYLAALRRQKGSLRMLYVYASSSLRDERWMFSRRGLALIKKCLTHSTRVW